MPLSSGLIGARIALAATGKAPSPVKDGGRFLEPHDTPISMCEGSDQSAVVLCPIARRRECDAEVLAYDRIFVEPRRRTLKRHCTLG